MLKRLSLFVLLLTGSAYANHFYVGGHMGLSSFQTIENTIIPKETHYLGGFGFTGGGFGGYNFCLPCNFDCGVEIFINGNTSKNKVYHHFNGTELSISSRYNWGVRALPGYRFCDSAEVHFIAGYTRGNFS